MGAHSVEVDAYLETADAGHRAALEELRRLIHEVHPEVEEVIEYQIPAFKLGANSDRVRLPRPVREPLLSARGVRRAPGGAGQT